VSSAVGPRAVLFDVDGTLVRSRGIAERFAAVAAEVFEAQVQPLAERSDGWTDPEILARLLRDPGAGAPAITPRLLARFELAWARALRDAIASGEIELAALPRAGDAVAALADVPGLHLGVVTGNLRAPARVKLAAAGLDASLREGAYGSDSPVRDLLPGVALERLCRAAGGDIDAAATIVVGDTPHDLRAARAHGMRCVLIAGGAYDRSELAACGPDRLVEGLAELAGAVEDLA